MQQFPSNLLPQVENLNQYSSSELKNFNRAEWEILKGAASRSENLVDFFDALKICEGVFRRLGADVDRVPPREKYNEQTCYMALLGWKLIIRTNT